MCGVPREQCIGNENSNISDNDSPPEPQQAEDKYLTEWLSDGRWFEQ